MRRGFWFPGQRNSNGASRRRWRLPLPERLESRLLLAADLGPTSLPLPEEIWQTLEQIPASPIDAESYLRPQTFTPFTADHSTLEQLLEFAPLEFTPAAERFSFEFSIPTPNGGFERFDVVEAPIMEPELAAQFPEIKTFRGQGIDNPAATVRFDVTPAGFHAQVLSPNGAYYVDPYYHLDRSVYVSYAGADLQLSEETQQLRNQYRELGVLDGDMLVTADGTYQLAEDGTLQDHAHDHAYQHDLEHASGLEATRVEVQPSKTLSSEEDLNPGNGDALQRSGDTLRTYRLANAATGEYTNFHGGTVAAGQAAIVTAINRVTGVYEVELAVRMVLVGNNSQLVYTNPNTDPYTNNNGGAMLSQNQSTIDSVIGSANYDIGHVFSTGGGGVAGLGVVGINGVKARGVTGLSSPINDAFYIDYVAHEMGHQFDGNHTFNGDSGSCAGGNRNSSTAYEPGSGSTIQAYAGICGNDDLQQHSDPYFHSISFDEIISFVDNQIPGVGTRTSTGNTEPTADAGPNYTIPAATPFRLTGSGSDADGDTLTYNWEERDRGPQADVNAPDNGSSPLFRSWEATTSPTRYFPRLQNLVNNNTVRGEKLPTLPRNMRFRLTVRDNRSGGGGVDTDDNIITVVNTGAPFAITSPNSGAVTWVGNATETVTWNVSGTDAGSVNTDFVNILLSTDGGFTYPITLASNVPNDGSQDITVPLINTTQARVLVEGAGNIFFDISNANFDIVGVDLDPPTAAGTAADITTAGGTTQTISVTYTDNLGVDASDVGDGDIEVLGPGGEVIPATFVSRSSDIDVSPITATYEIAAPGGNWDYLDNGTYEIVALPGEVRDVTGLFLEAGVIGSFDVNLEAPGSSCGNPGDSTVLGDGLSDLIYNPVTGLMSLRIDGNSFPEDGVAAIFIPGPEPIGIPPGAPFWGSAVYFNGQMSLLLPFPGPGVETDLPLLIYDAGLSFGDFGCITYNTVDNRDRFTSVGIAADTVAPTASSNPANVTTAGGSVQAFDVVFDDNEAVEGADIQTGVVRVTGPGGYDEVAALQSVTPNGNGAPLTATFEIPAPGGTWDAADQGTYSIEIVEFLVTDLTNNFLAGGAIATFDVNLGGMLDGDFDNDGVLDCDDIDELSHAIASGSTDPTYDLDLDGNVDLDDLQVWVVDLKGTLFGDANLDFTVDGQDFLVWNANKFGGDTAWCTGDFNADGITDGLDFVIWNANKFESAPRPVVTVSTARQSIRVTGNEDQMDAHAEIRPCGIV